MLRDVFDRTLVSAGAMGRVFNFLYESSTGAACRYRFGVP
jgi:hypothetical protein